MGKLPMMADVRSLWFVAPGRLEIAPLPEPLPALVDGQVLVRTLFSGISSGTELLAYRGELDADLSVDETIGALGGTFTYPFRYGYSCVGVIEESRSSLSEGTLVFAFHPHQNRFVASAGAAIPVRGVAARDATLYPLVETALQIVLDAGPLLGETVVVFGLGVVGALAAVMLQRAGAQVVAVEPRSWRREVVATLGVTVVAPDDLHDALHAHGDGRGVPLVIEASGSPEVLTSALPLLAHEGTALVASWYGTKPVTLPLGQEFHRRRLTIRSSQVSTIPAHLTGRWDPDRRRRAVVELLDELPLAALATHTYRFDDAGEAYAALDSALPGLIHVALGYG